MGRSSGVMPAIHKYLEHFQFPPEDERVGNFRCICLHCGREVACSDKTRSNLRSHLKSSHPGTVQLMDDYQRRHAYNLVIPPSFGKPTNYHSAAHSGVSTSGAPVSTVPPFSIDSSRHASTSDTGDRTVHVHDITDEESNVDQSEDYSTGIKQEEQVNYYDESWLASLKLKEAKTVASTSKDNSNHTDNLEPNDELVTDWSRTARAQKRPRDPEGDEIHPSMSPAQTRVQPPKRSAAPVDLDQYNLSQLVNRLQTIVTSRNSEIEEHHRRLHLINQREQETLSAVRKKLGV